MLVFTYRHWVFRLRLLIILKGSIKLCCQWRVFVVGRQLKRRVLGELNWHGDCHIGVLVHAQLTLANIASHFIFGKVEILIVRLVIAFIGSYTPIRI